MLVPSVGLEVGLVLLLLFVLLVGRQRHVHLHLDLWTRAAGNCRPQDLISEQYLIKDFVVGSWTHKVLVVNVARPRRVNSNEVILALVLEEGVSDNIPVATI